MIQNYVNIWKSWDAAVAVSKFCSFASKDSSMHFVARVIGTEALITKLLSYPMFHVTFKRYIVAKSIQAIAYS